MQRFSLLAGLLLAALLPTQAAHAATGDPLDLHAYKGKVVYVDFWASWCGPCRDSFPWMQQVQERYRERGLVVVGVNLDQERALADEFLKTYRPGFTVLFDQKAKLAEDFRVKGMPTSFVIDRNGTVRYQHNGFHLNQHGDYERELEALLAEK